MDKPVTSKCISAQTRVYYIDTHKDHKGQPYLTISEIPKDKTPGNKKRQRVFVHANNADAFLEAIQEAVKTIKKNDAKR